MPINSGRTGNSSQRVFSCHWRARLRDLAGIEMWFVGVHPAELTTVFPSWKRSDTPASIDDVLLRSGDRLANFRHDIGRLAEVGHGARQWHLLGLGNEGSLAIEPGDFDEEFELAIHAARRSVP